MDLKFKVNRDKRLKRAISVAVLCILVSLSGVTKFIPEKESKKKEENSELINKYIFEENVKNSVIKEGNASETIRKIRVDGEINSAMTNRDSKGSVINQIKDAKEDPNVKAILLSVNSPGGGVYESAELYQALQESGKDIYVKMNQLAASGGYYISMTAKKIYAQNETVTGSIGVVMSYISAQKFLNDHGIKKETIRSGNEKAVGGIAEDLTDESRKIYQNLNKESFDRFVKIVAKGRNLPEDDVRKLADGRIYSGEQAVKNKLIDKIGSEEDLINLIKEEKKFSNPRVDELKVMKKDNIFDKLTGSFLSKIKEEGKGIEGIKQSYIVK